VSIQKLGMPTILRAAIVARRGGKPPSFQTLTRVPDADGNVSTRGFPGIGKIEVAFSKVERNLIECALFPLFRLRQPENLAFGIQQGTLPAHKFLIANFDELVHELHSCHVKPINAGIIAESGTAVPRVFSRKEATALLSDLSVPTEKSIAAPRQISLPSRAAS
jgi:hypothetical protein